MRSERAAPGWYVGDDQVYYVTSPRRLILLVASRDLDPVEEDHRRVDILPVDAFWVAEEDLDLDDIALADRERWDALPA